jgi:uncharacterized protein (AIM24 family)
MATLKNLLGTGTSGGQAIAINGSVTLAQTASGATQGAQQTPTEIVVYTSSTVNYGPTLPVGNPGDTYFLTNLTANTIKVWPPVGGYIQNGAVNAADTILTNRSAYYVCIDSLNYVHVQGAAA